MITSRLPVDIQAMVDFLRQSRATPSAARLKSAREVNLTAILSRWNFPLCPYPIDAIIGGYAPQTIAKFVVDFIIRAYDVMLRDVTTNTSWEHPQVAELFSWAVLISQRSEYDFMYDQQLLALCGEVVYFCRSVDNEWERVIAYYVEWKRHENSLPWVIGIAAIFCIVAKVFCLAPSIMPGLDFSTVISTVYAHGDAAVANNERTQYFDQELAKVVLSARRQIAQSSRTTVSPSVLELLKHLEERPLTGKDLMERLHLSRRELSVQLLQFALKELLIVKTENNLHSPLQRYALTDAGRWELQLMRGVF